MLLDRAALIAKRVWEYWRKDVVLHGGYPLEQMFAHSLYSVAAWKSEHGAPSLSLSSHVFHLFGGFFCIGYGGSHVRDWAMGLSPGIFTSTTVPQGWLVAFLMVNYAPGVESLVTKPGGAVNVLVNIFERIDSSTTVCGSCEKAIAAFPSSELAPVIAALAAGVGGAMVRMLERAHRGEPSTEAHYSGIRKAVRVTLFYTCIYLWLRARKGAERARVAIACIDVAWYFAQLATGSTLDFTKRLANDEA